MIKLSQEKACELFSGNTERRTVHGLDIINKELIIHAWFKNVEGDLWGSLGYFFVGSV